MDNEMNGQNSIEELMQVEQIEESANLKVDKLNEKIGGLHQDQQILKETLKSKQREVLNTYQLLWNKKKQLVKLVTQKFNSKTISLDIGLQEQFQGLRNVIDQQSKTIDQLRSDISKQGLSGGNIDQSGIKLKKKTQQVLQELKQFRLYASTQYVRDYLERPLAYKVAYEEVKYEYQMRLKLKQTLESEKKAYDKKMEQLNVLKRKERQIEQQLQKERDLLKLR